MSCVSLILTGDCERLSLPTALGRHFPSHVFFAAEGRHDGFTSTGSAIVSFAAQTAETRVEKLLKTALGEVCRKGDARFAVIVDDIEVENLTAIANVTKHVRDAATHLVRSGAITPQQATKLRECCSFHFLCPMVESWFFAYDAALQSAGVEDLSRNQRSLGDAELFTVTTQGDPAFFENPDEPKKLRKKGIRPWARSNRGQHPKSYLEFLQRDGDKTRYSETVGGAAALAEMDVAQLLAAPTEMRFARSLITDLALMLGEQAPIGSVAADTWHAAGATVLRNL